MRGWNVTESIINIGNTLPQCKTILASLTWAMLP